MLGGICRPSRAIALFSVGTGHHTSGIPAPSAVADVAALEAALGYSFDDASMREAALLHSSVGGRDFQRLEYLGDAALSSAIALWLYQHHQDWDEGQLTVARSALVQRGYLIDMAQKIGLDKHLRVSGSLGSPDCRDHPVLADAFEALLGAVLLDGGTESVAAVVEHLFDEQDLERDWADFGHPKSLLQQWLQARGLDLPEYRERARRGADHAFEFEVECLLGASKKPFVGTGRSLQAAETQAALEALEHLRLAASQ